MPELKLEGVRFRVYREATQRAHGDAAVATYRRDTQAVKARDLSAFLSTEEGETVHITAPESGGNLDQGTFDASGGVVATRGTETTRTERAWYVPTPTSGGFVQGDRPVVVTGDGYRLEGNGFTYEPDTGEIVFQEGARLDAGREDRR